VTGLFWATGVHDIKQKGRANPLKNQGLRPKVPAAKQRKETGLSQKSSVSVPSELSQGKQRIERESGAFLVKNGTKYLISIAGKSQGKCRKCASPLSF
jgi:hypothetical protein